MDNTVFIDVETTGTDPTTDRVIQLGILKGSQEIDVLINPECPIPPAVSEINGIFDKDVKYRPTFEHYAQRLYDLLETADVFVAFNYQFDFSFIQAELARYGFDLPSSKFVFIDPMVIFKKKVPHSLASAYRYYMGTELQGAHNALVDIIATKQVLMKQLEMYDDYKGKTPKEVQLLTIGEVGVVGKWFEMVDGHMVFKQGKHKGAKIKSQPSYLRWIAGLPDVSYDEKKYIEELFRHYD